MENNLKRCSCGATHDRHSWSRLQLVTDGLDPDEVFAGLELRRCNAPVKSVHAGVSTLGECGSTLAVEVGFSW